MKRKIKNFLISEWPIFSININEKNLNISFVKNWSEFIFFMNPQTKHWFKYVVLGCHFVIYWIQINRQTKYIDLAGFDFISHILSVWILGTGSRFKIKIRIRDQGSKIKVPRSRIQDSRSRIQDQGSRIQNQGSRIRIQTQGSRVKDPRSRIQEQGSRN